MSDKNKKLLGHVFELIGVITVVALYISAVYFAWIEHDYTHATFDLLLAYGMGNMVE